MGCGGLFGGVFKANFVRLPYSTTLFPSISGQEGRQIKTILGKGNLLWVSSCLSVAVSPSGCAPTAAVVLGGDGEAKGGLQGVHKDYGGASKDGCCLGEAEDKYHPLFPRLLKVSMAGG